MEICTLSEKISRAYLEENFPNQLLVLDEYIKIISADVDHEKLSDSAYRFGPFEVISQVVAPVVLGIVTNYLYDLIKHRLPSPKKNDANLARKELLKVIQNNRKKIERNISKRYKDKKLVGSVLDYVELYLENANEPKDTGEKS